MQEIKSGVATAVMPLEGATLAYIEAVNRETGAKVPKGAEVLVSKFTADAVTKRSDGDDAGKKTWVQIVTREVTDRDGDVMRVKGMHTDNWDKAKRVLWAHDLAGSVLPIAKGLWLKKEKGEDGIPQAVSKAAMWDGAGKHGDFCRELYDMIDQGYINTASHTFFPLQTEELDRDDAGGRRGFDIKEWELWEWSMVPVPSNPAALTVAVEKGVLDAGALLRKYAEAADKLKLSKATVALVTHDLSTLAEPERKCGVCETIMEHDKGAWICRACHPKDADTVPPPESVADAPAHTEPEPADCADDLVQKLAAYEATIERLEADAKSGRVLSTKNRGTIQKAVSAMSEATAALKDLLQNADKPPEEPTEPKAAKVETPAPPALDQKALVAAVSSAIGPLLRETTQAEIDKTIRRLKGEMVDS